jgi:hypothetical protein
MLSKIIIAPFAHIKCVLEQPAMEKVAKTILL